MVLVLPLILLNACRTDADRNWTTPDPSFKLYETTGATNVLYPTMETNPFFLKWDAAPAGAGNYSVVVSTTADFKNKVELSKATGTTLNTTIGALNAALLKAGFDPYKATTVYVRIESGTQVSNTISFSVTTYPTDKPIIKNPTAGQSIILDGANPDLVALTVKWMDYPYAVDVNYTVEIALKGSTAFIPVGSTVNTTQIDWTNYQLDAAVLKLGVSVGVASDIDIRVTAITKSVGGTISKTSDVVTFSVTPYQLVSYLYAPGAYQGWNPPTANTLTSATSNGIYVGYINFTEANTEFKVNPARNWDNSYGSTGVNTLVYNGGDNLKAPNAGSQKLTVDLNAMTYELSAYSWGIIGSASPQGWNASTAMTYNDATGKWEITVPLIVGEIKFRLNDAWDVNYGDDGNNGSLDQGGANIPITEAGNYEITFDEVNLVWTKTKI